MADGQTTTFDDINASLTQYRAQKQPKQPTTPAVPKLAAAHIPAPPAPPKQPQAFSFDTLTSELNQKRQQRGDKTPVTLAEPKALQITGQENAQNQKEVVNKVVEWKDRQQERLGNWVASKLQYSPEEIKAQLDKTPAWEFKLAHNLFQAAEIGFGKTPDLTPFNETETRKSVQKSMEAENKLAGWADKQVVSFVTDPVNVAFMASGSIEAKPLLKLAINGFFTAQMARGAYQGARNAYEAGKAANWDVFTTTGDDGHFQFKPEAAAFWEAMGDTAVSGFFAGMGLTSLPHEVGLLREYGKFNDPKITGVNKHWPEMNQSERATALANVQRHAAEADKGIDAATKYSQLAHEFGLKPKPKDQAEAASRYAEATKDIRDRIAQAEKHNADLLRADITIVAAPEKRSTREMEPPPMLGELTVEKQSKIWTPDGEKEITVKEPAASESGNRDLAVLNPQDREFARQKQRESYAHTVLDNERKRREDEYARKAQRFQDEIKREAEKRQQAEESGLKVDERRQLRYMTDTEVKRFPFGDLRQRLTDQMEGIANRNMFVNVDQMANFLRRPNRDRPYTPEEQDFLRMDEESRILQRYQDPANLPPVRTGVEQAPPEPEVTKPEVLRSRLSEVTSAEQAQQVLEGADDSQVSGLMIPLNRAFAESGKVYGHAGERPLFSDKRGDMHEGSSWKQREGVDVLATVPVHPGDVPKWGIPSDQGQFILQVTKEGDGVFGEKGYSEPQVVLGKVDPSAERRNWDWTDWAAGEANRRENAFFEELAAVDRQNDLENASIELSNQSKRADSPEEADELQKKSQEAEESAKAIEQERSAEEAREASKKSGDKRFPEKAPIEEVGRGRDTEISLPSGRKLKAHYALVSLDNVIASHKPMSQFEPNEDYVWFNKDRTNSPLQPNDYRSNEHRQEETKFRASNPDFGQIFNTSSTGDQGPPTLRRDGMVAGENNRAFILEMLYASGRGNEVIRAIDATKEQFGISGETPSFEDSPVIVRVLDEPLESVEDLVDVGQQLNRDQMTKKNAAEDAAATALRFNQEFMDWIVSAFDGMDDDASLRDFMRKYATQLADRYIQHGIIAHTERGAFITDKGEINPDAKLKFERAVRGVVIKDPVALAVLEQPGMAAQANALDRALPGLLRMVAKGGVWDISDYLPEAIKRWESINDIRPKLQDEIRLAHDLGQKGVSLVDVYLYPEKVKGTTGGFGDMVERPRVDAITESLMRLLDKKPKDIREAFNQYSLDAEGLQATLTAAPLPWESFDKNIGSRVGMEINESDWGSLEARPLEKGPESSPLPPEVPAVPPPLVDQPKFKFGNTQADIPDNSAAAKALEAARSRISDSDLAGKGKDIGGNHVTVRYGIKDADVAGIKAFLQSQKPFDATLGKTEKFEPTEQSEGTSVIKAPIESAELRKINAELAKHGNFIDPTFDYSPHATVAYVKPEVADRYVGMDVTKGKKFRIESVSISHKDGSTETVKLEGKPHALQVPPPPMAVAPETGGNALPPSLGSTRGEELLRLALEKHSGISPAQREGAIQVWRAFSENYLGKSLEEFLRDHVSGIEVGGEPKEGLGQSEGKVQRGMTEFADDGKALMHLFEKANFSTFAHESFHVMRRHLKPEDTEILGKYAGVKDGAWTTAAEEKTARAWERYLRDGKAPNEQLRTLFAKLKAWMSAIYQQIKGSPLEVKVSEAARGVFDRMLTGENVAEKIEPPPVPESDRGIESPPVVAALSPEEKKEVQNELGVPDFLFQEDSQQARDLKIRMIQDKLKGSVTADMRGKLERMMSELQGDRPVERKAAEAPTLPSEPEKKAIEPLPKRTVKIWTPQGEIEVVREEPRSEAPKRADKRGEPVNGIDRDKESRSLEPLPERPKSAAGSDAEPNSRRGVSTRGRAGAGRGDSGVSRKSLPDVPTTQIDAPKRERGAPLYEPEDWKNRVSTYLLPESMPVPTVQMDADLARLLIFPGQKELAESALSGLKQHDAYILATATGTGKTYLSSSIVSQIIRREKPKNVLILTPSQNLVSDFKNVLLDFDVEGKSLPDGVGAPEAPGVFVSTYATANMRDGLADHPWDFVVMDEADAARRWYDSQQGAMAKKLGENAGKVLYMSATPFHTALELGHMTKLGLWDTQGFDQWGKQFGIYRDKNGNYGGGNAPRKLVELRQQLIERGQFAQLDRQMDGYKPHFLLAPLTAEDKAGLHAIVESFDIAKDYYARKGKQGLMRSLQGNMVVYMKSYLERRRLPQAIELAKRAEKEGYKTIIFSEHKAGRTELFSLLEEPDAWSGGKIKELLPQIPDVVEELQGAFGNDIANFSGKHSIMRSEEKEAFINNDKKHIYATYGAGGRGVSLHDTNGKYPRVAIYLGPPYSGVMLDQAIGRPWRFGTKSDVQAYFMLSNARDEVDLVIKKVAPRLESLRALVSGIDMTDPMTVAMRRLESAQDGAMAFDLGQAHATDKDGLSTTYDHVPIMNWREAPMPPASEQMNKGMRLPGAVSPHPGVSRLMQAEEFELPGDISLPDSVEARMANEETAEDFAKGQGAHGLTPAELRDIPAPERVAIADSEKLLSDAAAKDNPEAPGAASRRSWENAGKLIKAAQDLPPTKAGRSLNWIWFTHGREVIRRAAERSGKPELGYDLARDIGRYHQETGVVAGPFQLRYYDISKKLTPQEHENMWLVKEGATRTVDGKKVPVEPMNDKVTQAVKDVTALMQDVKDLLAKDSVYTEFYDETTGRRMQVPFADQLDDQHYMPHRYDYDRKIIIQDPKTGQSETLTLRDVLKGKDLGQSRYEAIVHSMAKEQGVSEAEVQDWLARRRRDVPLVGNVERSREMGLPYYRMDPEAMIGYLEGVGETVARTRVFGQDRHKLELKFRQIPEQRDRALIRDIFDSLLSRKQYDEDTRAFVHVAADWAVLSKMAFSAVKIPFHMIHSSLHTNARTLLKTMLEGATNYHEMRDRAVYSGSVLEQMRANLASELGMDQRFASKLLRWNQFHNAYTMDRALTNASARIWMDDTALPKLAKDRSSEFVRRQLKDVYLLSDEAIDKAIASKRWTEDDYARGGKALSDRTMFTFDPTELPPGWRARSNEPIADSALAAVRVMTLMKSFMFKTGVIMKDRLWTEAKKGNFRPWIPFLLYYPLAGEAMRQIGAALTFNPKQADWWTQPENQEPAKIIERAAEDIGYSTGMTALYWLAKAPLGQKGWATLETLAGPVYSDIAHTVLKLPAELSAAKSDYATYNALKRWLEGTVPATRPLVSAGEAAVDYDPEAEKKKAQHDAAKRGAETRRRKQYGAGRPL